MMTFWKGKCHDMMVQAMGRNRCGILPGARSAKDEMEVDIFGESVERTEIGFFNF